MNFVVGLTGGIGSGKSTVSKLFEDLGITVIDTDVISRKLTEVNGIAINRIRENFGEAYTNSIEGIDRAKMRELIFSDKEARNKLEKILHPLILNEVKTQIEKVSDNYIIVVVPLLFEIDDYQNIVDRTLVVDCDERQQLIRTMARSQLSEEKVKAIMATQMTRQQRLQKSHDVIFNDEDIDHLKKQVLSLHQKYMILSKDGQNHINN
ncbi:MAG TPA: dephospho-CoA kinase [Nitrosomonas sp.]|nr:dephospho-CoA kinase [Nitrosomonas sp.]HQX13546.1 dephospho-CoA kinase [Nitrosomonas sp.]HRB21119.1 dephospho-CoA kinase [Nitrosomonas sp.]HRB32932.1 dephospho-CoA kinase [Nitrosomonas sp.]HRB45593.1 dephospho-CoA kinase [Nitrosomonas sp.]